MRLAILQSNYIPWKGYFDIMNLADEFIIYDSVQYTKNDWRNRNVLKTPTGITWLTIPIVTAGKSAQRINEAVISDSRWARKHWTTIEQNFRRYACFDYVRESWREWYAKSTETANLHDVNMMFLRGLASQLGLRTRLRDDREFELQDDSPTGKLVQLCLQTGADRYVTGPSALAYLDLDQFHAKNIQVEVIRYDDYPPYPQVGESFRHEVSVLDLLASTGPDAGSHLRGHFSTLPIPESRIP